VLTVAGFACYTLELPWLENRKGKSCIPEGTYRARFGIHYNDASPYRCIELFDVPGRSEIEIHIANKPSDLLGCIAPGRKLGGLDGERAVLASKAALQKLLHVIDPGASSKVEFPFRVQITSAFGRFAPHA